jgi:hypothetical protein
MVRIRIKKPRMHFFDVLAAPEASIAKHVSFKDMKNFTVDTKEGKSMKFYRIPIYARHPQTNSIQDALLRLPQQQVSAAYGDAGASKVRVAVDIVQNGTEVEQTFSALADATLPMLQKVAMATNRKFTANDLDGLRVKTYGESGGACKLYVDVHRFGTGARRATRFYRDTEDMSDVPISQLFATNNDSGDSAGSAGFGRKRGRDEGGDGSVLSITPFKAELLINIESVLIGPSSLRFVMTVVEGLVPSDVGLQYSMLRPGKVWGATAPTPAALETAPSVVDDEVVSDTTEPQPQLPAPELVVPSEAFDPFDS